MTSRDIQERVKRHLYGTAAERSKLEAGARRDEARRLARLVAIEALKLVKAGNVEEAKKAQAEAHALVEEWRKLGGKGPLT
jgi:predicted translin family RNA/ssDNA-binding protein